jgi:pimeloyl-ACP methyl ester carboxylesterase
VTFFRILLFLAMAAGLGAQRMRDLQIPRHKQPDSTVVIGFLGGFERWNDAHRGVRKVALDLQAQGVPNLYVVTIENRHRDLAVKVLKRMRPRRVVLYGQSLGGAAALYTAREIRKFGLDVELTIQVDSVGMRDTVVPSNVRAAANLYQHDPLTLEGAGEIHAENPARTRIIENTRLTYLWRPYSTLTKEDSSWIRRTFGGSHAKMEADEGVWRHVEDLILIAIR